jgi:hypothetical protein
LLEHPKDPQRALNARLCAMFLLVLAGNEFDLPCELKENFAFIVDEKRERRGEPDYKAEKKCTHKIYRASSDSIRNPRQ